MAYNVPAYPIITHAGPAFAYSVNRMGNMKELIPQFSNDDKTAQQANKAASQAAVMALTPGAIAESEADAEAARIALMTATELERQRRKKRNTTTMLLVAGAVVAYMAIAGGD